MRSPSHACSLSLLVVLLGLYVPVLGASSEDTPFTRTLERVLSLLPKRPPVVAVIVSEPREAGRSTDAARD